MNVPGPYSVVPLPSHRDSDGRAPPRRSYRFVFVLVVVGVCLSLSTVASLAVATSQGGPSADTAQPERLDLSALSASAQDADGSATTNTTTTTGSATSTPVTPSTNGAATDAGDATTEESELTATATPGPATTAAEESPTGTATSSDPVFVVGNVTVPEVVRANGSVAVSATVRNLADVGGTERLNYSLAGRSVASKRVTLGAAESTAVTFRTRVSALEPGTYVHGVRNASGDGVARRLRVTPDADLAVGGFDAPTAVSRGEPFVVLATLANPADTSITRRVSYVFDGEVVTSRSVTVAPGERERVAYEIGIAADESVVGPVADGTTHTHAVSTAGGSRRGGELNVRQGPVADASALAVERFSAPDDVRPGERVRATLSVRNVDTTVFAGQIAYRIDGAVVDVGWVRVPEGERRNVSFAVSHGDLERRSLSLSAGQTTQDVWVGGEPLDERPLAIYGPFTTPTPERSTTPTFSPAGSGPDSGGGSVATARSQVSQTPGTSCSRGLFSKCGGTALDETSLTLLGIFTSVLGILYEMVTG